ncbi:MAG: polyprenyl synthetase family protein [Hyphomonadaceae bacterium]|nr:polyprenyl synthetase family protein [Clostridia bacterium]
MDFSEKIKQYILLVDEYLEKYLPQKENIQYEIYQAMRYSLFAGGKRLRPVLTLAACETAGGNMQDAIAYACAIEMIHTYSLIHDDLPAMDDDHLRRGKPTCHIKFNEAFAILAGDALLNKAFEVMIMDAQSANLPHARSLEAISVIANAAGTEGMIGGQVADMIAQGKQMDENYLNYMHAHKTGALITAAVCAGAIIGGADEKALESYRTYGEKLGLAFQIQDDILDIEGDEETLGKPIGSDQDKDKFTYVTVCGLPSCKEKVRALTVQSIKALQPVTHQKPFLIELANYLINREH